MLIPNIKINLLKSPINRFISIGIALLNINKVIESGLPDDFNINLFLISFNKNKYPEAANYNNFIFNKNENGLEYKETLGLPFL